MAAGRFGVPANDAGHPARLRAVRPIAAACGAVDPRPAHRPSAPHRAEGRRRQASCRAGAGNGVPAASSRCVRRDRHRARRHRRGPARQRPHGQRHRCHARRVHDAHRRPRAHRAQSRLPHAWGRHVQGGPRRRCRVRHVATAARRAAAACRRGAVAAPSSAATDARYRRPFARPVGARPPARDHARRVRRPPHHRHAWRPRGRGGRPHGQHPRHGRVPGSADASCRPVSGPSRPSPERPDHAPGRA